MHQGSLDIHLIHLFIVSVMSFFSFVFFAYISKFTTTMQVSVVRHCSIFFLLIGAGFFINLIKEISYVLYIGLSNSLYIVCFFILRRSAIIRSQHIANNKKIKPLYKCKTMYATLLFAVGFLQIGVFYTWYDSLFCRIIVIVTILVSIFSVTSYEVIGARKGKPLEQADNFLVAFFVLIPTFNIIMPLLLFYFDAVDLYHFYLLPIFIIQIFVWSIIIMVVLLLDTLEIHYERSIRDELTGLFNRDHFSEKFEELTKPLENSKSQRYGVLMFDIDDFKLINDKYGHAAGDKVIRTVAATLKKKVLKYYKGETVVARLGGEEFGLLCMNSFSHEHVAAFADSLRQSIEQKEISYADNIIKVTVSVGFAVSDSEAVTNKNIIRNVDKALYVAKNTGKNKVCSLVESNYNSHGDFKYS